MNPDLVTLERALVVMAVCLVVQTVMLVAGAVGAWIAYRRAADAAEREIRELRAVVDELAASSRRAVDTLVRGTESVRDVIDDARHAVDVTGEWATSAASLLTTAPKRAAAQGLLQAVLWWRRRRRHAGADSWVA